MKNKLQTQGYAVVAGIALVAVAALFSGPSVLRTPSTASGMADDTLMLEAPIETGTVSHRRKKASLSMPYFSFAQSLRPRG